MVKLTLALPERVSPMETMTAGPPVFPALLARGEAMAFAALGELCRLAAASCYQTPRFARRPYLWRVWREKGLGLVSKIGLGSWETGDARHVHHAAWAVRCSGCKKAQWWYLFGRSKANHHESRAVAWVKVKPASAPRRRGIIMRTERVLDKHLLNITHSHLYVHNTYTARKRGAGASQPGRN